MPAPTTIQKLQYIHQFACQNAPDLSFSFLLHPQGLHLRAWGDSRKPVENAIISYNEIDSAPKAHIEKIITTCFEKARVVAKNAEKEKTT